MKRCGLSAMHFKYINEDWKCSSFDKEDDHCSDCSARVRQNKIEMDQLTKEHIDNAEVVNADSSPIVSDPYLTVATAHDCSCKHKRGRWCGDDGKGNEEILGQWKFFPSSSKHFGGHSSAKEIDNIDQTISWFKRMDDDYCNFLVERDFPKLEDMHPELQKGF